MDFSLLETIRQIGNCYWLQSRTVASDGIANEVAKVGCIDVYFDVISNPMLKERGNVQVGNLLGNPDQKMDGREP
jgi:hypothetical protein